MRCGAVPREIVDGERPTRRAISRTPSRCARRIAISSRSANDRYRPDSGDSVIGGIPPACRNHLEPTACDTPAPTAASSLDAPRAIASQNRTRSSRRAADGRPGDHIWPRIARIACWRFPAPISPHLQIEMLRRPVESALDAAVGMMDKRASYVLFPAEDRHLQRVQGQAGAQVVSDLPADNLAGEQVGDE